MLHDSWSRRGLVVSEKDFKKIDRSESTLNCKPRPGKHTTFQWVL